MSPSLTEPSLHPDQKLTLCATLDLSFNPFGLQFPHVWHRSVTRSTVDFIRTQSSCSVKHRAQDLACSNSAMKGGSSHQKAWAPVSGPCLHPIPSSSIRYHLVLMRLVGFGSGVDRCVLSTSPVYDPCSPWTEAHGSVCPGPGALVGSRGCKRERMKGSGIRRLFLQAPWSFSYFPVYVTGTMNPIPPR